MLLVFVNLFLYWAVLGTASKPNRRLTGGSVRFRPVSIVLNNDNRPEPNGTAGQPAVGFWNRPLLIKEVQHFQAFAFSYASSILLYTYDSYLNIFSAAFNDGKEIWNWIEIEINGFYVVVMEMLLQCSH